MNIVSYRVGMTTAPLQLYEETGPLRLSKETGAYFFV